MKVGPRVFIPIICLSILFSASLYSLPRLAAEHAVACKSCHINPNGGGARTEFGNHSVAFHELCLPQTKKLLENKYNKPRLSESVLIGFDARYLVFENGRIFRMQTDAYLTFEPYKEFYYHLNFWESGIKENYALFYLDNQKYFLKLGRFAPAYGLRMDDHKSYVREQLGFGSNLYRDGLSMGAEVRGVNIVGEIYNPNDQFVGTLHSYRTGFIDPFGYLAGFSVRISETANGSTGTNPHTRGVFGGISYDRFTLMGELDFAGKGNDSVLAYASLSSRLEYGLYFIAEYNFFDPDKNMASGVDEFVRLSLEFYPLPYVQLRPSYTYFTKGILQDEEDFFLLFHVGY